MCPLFLKDEWRLWRARRLFPNADYILSPHVSPDAHLGIGVGIARDAVVSSGVSIGDHSYINRGAIVASGGIGRFTSIAHYCQVGGEEHPYRHFSMSPHIFGAKNLLGARTVFDELVAPPQIGSDVWIGGNAVVLQGVRVGHGAVIGAGAVVRRDVEPYAIAVGVPARQIGRRFDDDVVSKLLRLSWWDWPSSELIRLRATVEAGDQFVEMLDRLLIDVSDRLST